MSGDLLKTTPTMKPCDLIFQFVIKHYCELKLKKIIVRPLLSTYYYNPITHSRCVSGVGAGRATALSFV